MLSIGYEDHAPGDVYERGDNMERWTLEYMICGHTRVTTPHGIGFYNDPSALLIPPRAAYRVERATQRVRWRERYAIFDPLPRWNSLLDWPCDETGLGSLDLSNSTIAKTVENLLKEALQYRRSALSNREALATNNFEKVLLWFDEVNPRTGHAQRDERVEAALQFIANNFDQQINIEELAREVFLSPSRLSHLFKDQMKIAPMQYLEQYRLERAGEKLLSGNDSIEAVANSVGFNNPFHFSTRFRRRFGQAPREYKKNPR